MKHLLVKNIFGATLPQRIFVMSSAHTHYPWLDYTAAGFPDAGVGSSRLGTQLAFSLLKFPSRQVKFDKRNFDYASRTIHMNHACNTQKVSQ